MNYVLRHAHYAAERVNPRWRASLAEHGPSYLLTFTRADGETKQLELPTAQVEVNGIDVQDAVRRAPVEAEVLPSAVGLVWRALVLWLLLVLLLSLR